MAIVPNNQSFSPAASGTMIQNMAGQFRAAMDTVLLGMGRDIIIHLPPNKTRCSADCRHNQAYQKFIGPNGQPCRVCAGQGYILEPRQTIYTANIRWIDDDLADPRTGGEATPGGRIYSADVRTKTVESSFNDILNCIGGEIDGIPVKLKTEPRRTGFGGQLFYTVAFWERTNRKTNI